MAKLGSWEYNLLTQRTHWCSDELYDIYGLNRIEHPEVTIELFKEMVYPDDQEPLFTELRNITSYSDYCREHRIIRPDGRIVSIRQNIEVGWEGGVPVRLTGIVQDITSQKVAEHLLVSSERRFRSLVQNGFDMISILDAEGNYIYASDSTFRLLGHDPGELIGKNAFDLIHSDDLIKTAKSFARLYKEVYVEDAEPFRFKNDKGEWRWLEVKAANLLYDSTINGFVINSRDITEKKLLQERLDRQMQEW